MQRAPGIADARMNSLRNPLRSVWLPPRQWEGCGRRRPYCHEGVLVPPGQSGPWQQRTRVRVLNGLYLFILQRGLTHLEQRGLRVDAGVTVVALPSRNLDRPRCPTTSPYPWHSPPRPGCCPWKMPGGGRILRSSLAPPRWPRPTVSGFRPDGWRPQSSHPG
jgi:hypothetical protein